MSTTELLVVLFGLFIGYWTVSKLALGKSAPQREQAPPAVESEPDPAAWNEVLGVSPEAGESEIRQAYKKLMQQYHPDKVASLGDELKALAERKSRDINTAYKQAMQIRGIDP